jgi:enamine deaminase RidA (YjgF/YER057c/UK114 family)
MPARREISARPSWPTLSDSLIRSIRTRFSVHTANAREQIEIAFENVKAALTSVGANFGNIVKLNNYIVDIGTNIAHYREVRDKYVNTAAPPASTTIGVPQLARPGALFEIEAIAVLPPK